MPIQPIPSQKSLALFETYKQAINESLATYLQTSPQKLIPTDSPLIALQALEFIREYTLRPGKRVRGALAAMAYDALIGEHLSDNGQKIAVAMELVQSYLLIVDDVTDKSDLRRGEPTVHRLYERQYKGKIGEREAEQLAFYTGMITGHMANLVLLNTTEKPENVARAMHYLHENIIITGIGQLDDIMQEISREATYDDVIRKYALKTSHYTFINPLQSGMALAGVSDEVAYQNVAAFGTAAGIAFQAHDDYLGVFGGTETGKPNTDDIKEGKLTVLTQYALEHGAPDDVRTLKAFLGNPNIGERELKSVREILNQSGATMEARQVAKRYAEDAIQLLSSVTIWDEAFKSLLAELVRYSIHRES